MHQRDGQTDGQTPGHSKDRAYAQRRAVKKQLNYRRLGMSLRSMSIYRARCHVI